MTEFQDRLRTYNNVTMQKRTITRDKIVYKTVKRKETRVRMVKKILKTRKRVPNNLTATLFCACYQKECACLGQEGCQCCQPACDCAPRVEDSYVEMIEEVEVPEEYETERLVEVPELTQVSSPEYTPVTTTHEWIEKVPVIV